jgi:hypothetical protein
MGKKAQGRKAFDKLFKIAFMLENPNQTTSPGPAPFVVKKASRQEVYLKCLLSGPSGSGKTYSSLLMARGLVDDWSQIAVIDTEDGTSHYYDHLGSYNVLEMPPPTDGNKYNMVQRFQEAVKYLINAYGIKVIVSDSISHYWEYILSMKEYWAGTAQYNDYTAWAKATPLYQSFVDFIRHTPVHFVCTVRSKQAYEIVKNEVNGNEKTTVQKIGQKSVQREGIDYEFDLQFDLDMGHHASIGTMGKKRIHGVFDDEEIFIITEDTGRKIRQWCETGTDISKVRMLVQNARNKDELNNLYNQFQQHYNELKTDFQASANRIGKQ